MDGNTIPWWSIAGIGGTFVLSAVTVGSELSGDIPVSSAIAWAVFAALYHPVIMTRSLYLFYIFLRDGRVLPRNTTDYLPVYAMDAIASATVATSVAWTAVYACDRAFSGKQATAAFSGIPVGSTTAMAWTDMLVSSIGLTLTPGYAYVSPSSRFPSALGALHMIIAIFVFLTIVIPSMLERHQDIREADLAEDREAKLS